MIILTDVRGLEWSGSAGQIGGAAALAYLSGRPAEMRTFNPSLPPPARS
jgi:hypothetical protein